MLRVAACCCYTRDTYMHVSRHKQRQLDSAQRMMDAQRARQCIRLLSTVHALLALARMVMCVAVRGGGAFSFILASGLRACTRFVSEACGVGVWCWWVGRWVGGWCGPWCQWVNNCEWVSERASDGGRGTDGSTERRDEGTDGTI